MDASDQILLLTTPDLASLHDASSFLQVSRSLGYHQDKLFLTLVKDLELGGVKSTDIETALHRPLDHKIPDDSPNALRSINRGIPLVMRYPRSPASRAIRQLAQKMATLRTTETSAAPEITLEKSKQDALLASSYFG
jgi:pilus assembly protein CpaE